MSASGEVRIELLGRFAVVIDGEPVGDDAWPGRRAVELVQLLALAPRRQLLREQVMDALWPHLDPEAAAANLRKAAHHVRQATGDADAVVLRGGNVRLFPARSVSCDAERWEQLATSALASDDAARCEAAADAYGGTLLPGALYEEWTQQPRERLRALQLRLERRAGRWEAVVELEPTDEAAYQELIRAALARGARAAGIRWYGRLRESLASGLGVPPSPESEALYEACLADVTRRRGELFGRQVELAHVEAVLREADKTPIGMVAVRGPAGVGKTALVEGIADLAERCGLATRRLRADESRTSYAPIAGLLEELVCTDPSFLGGVNDHSRSVMRALTPTVEGEALTSPLSRHQVVGVLTQVLRAAAAAPNHLVILDDAHTVDGATIEALQHLAATVPDIAVVLSFRDAASIASLDRALAHLDRSGRLHQVDLGPLDERAARAVVEAGIDAELPAALVDHIVDRSEGNPFVLTELARAADAGDPGALPATVSDAVLARLVDVDGDTVDVLRRLALASDDLDSDIVVALTGDTDDAACSILDEALEADILVVRSGRYRFRHDLVREVLCEQVPPHQRSAVHRDVARRLAVAGAPPGVIAHHWLAGGRPEDAASWSLQAARDSLALGAFGDARRHLASVLAHDASHAEASRLDAEALDLMGEPGALAAYDRAIDLAAEVDRHDLVAMRALAQLKQGDPAGALEAIRGATPTSVNGRLSEALTYAGAAALGFADPAFGTAKAAECRRIALQSGDAGSIVVASWAQAAAAHARGELHDSVLADLRETKDLPHLAVRVFDGQLCITQRFLYGARPYNDVIAFADALADEGARLGAARGHAFGVTLRGEAELLSGRLADAEADLIEGGRLHRSIGGATGEALALQRLAELALRRDDPARAAVLLSEALDLARVTDIGFHLLDRIYGTRIELATDPDEALVAVDEAESAVRGPLETCPGCRITFAVPAAIACARAGDVDRALDFQEATEFLAHVVMRLPAWDAAYEEVRAHIAHAMGDDDRACELFSLAADGFEAAGQPYDRDRCRRLAQ